MQFGPMERELPKAELSLSRGTALGAKPSNLEAAPESFGSKLWAPEAKKSKTDPESELFSFWGRGQEVRQRRQECPACQLFR
jgi:hypothetical protein